MLAQGSLHLGSVRNVPASHLKPVFLRGNPDKPLGRPISLAGGREYRGGRARPRLHGEEAGDIISAACHWLSHGYVPVREREREGGVQLGNICATFSMNESHTFFIKLKKNKQSFNIPFSIALKPSIIPYICHSKFLIHELNCSHDYLQVQYNLTCKCWPSAVGGMNSDLAWLFKIQK